MTGVWPTADRPSAGVYVRRRVDGTTHRVVASRSYSGSTAVRYLRLAWDALTARGRFDGVEAHILFPAGVIGLLAAWIRRIPLVVYAHGADVRITANENRVYRALSAVVARRASIVITNSSSTRVLVRSLGADALILPPGIDTAAFAPTARPAARRVLYLGGVEHHKGYDRAVGVADTLAGPGLAEVRPEAVPALIADHDIVLVPSRAEPFGLVAAESIASGRWVVAADVDGLRDIVIDGVNGSLVSNGDFAGAVRDVGDYDPWTISRTVQHLSLASFREAMDRVWADVLARRHKTP